MAWTEAHVSRLLWRAGFGPRPGETKKWAKAGKERTLDWLLDPRAPKLIGPEPKTSKGAALDPVNVWSHDILWWLDRMVRAERPLQEKLTLFWTGHFACADQDRPLLLHYNKTLRRHSMGSFDRMLAAVTVHPAMLLFLSLANSDKDKPNENFPRELMELFTLGTGYTEADIREAARAMTGFKAKWGPDGLQRTYYDPAARDLGTKRIFGKRGRFDYKDVLRLVVEHPRHAPFLVEKLWGFFVTEPLDTRTRARLLRTYRDSGRKLRPLVRAILAHPKLYAGLDAPQMVKAPVVYVAGMLRTTGRGVDRDAWGWLLPEMGQHPLEPPSVAGWEQGPAWLSTVTMRTRFIAATELLRDAIPDKSVPHAMTPSEHVQRALSATGRPWHAPSTREVLLRHATDVRATAAQEEWKQEAYATMTQRALRHLLLSGPDAQVH